MHALLRVAAVSIGCSVFAGTAYLTAITYAPAPTYTVSDSDRERTWEDIAGSYCCSTRNQEFYLGIRGMRKQLAKEAKGDVLEVGAGTGSMVGLYPLAIDERDRLLGRETAKGPLRRLGPSKDKDVLAGLGIDPQAEEEMKASQAGDKLALGGGAAQQGAGVRSVVMGDRAQNMLLQLERKIEDTTGEAPHRIVLAEEAKKWTADAAVAARTVDPAAAPSSLHPHYVTAQLCAENIPFADSSFDTVVDIFGLCSYDDPVKALLEMSRVCKEDGRILLLEHGRGTWSRVNMQLDKWAPRHAKSWGCWWNRDMRRYLRLAGMTVVKREEKHFGTTHKLVVRPNKNWMAKAPEAAAAAAAAAPVAVKSSA